MGTIIDDRIDVRISKEQKELVKQACTLSGFKNLSEFVVFCISKEAKAIIKENDTILKSLEDKKIFVNTLLQVAEPTAKLSSAHDKYIEFIKEQNEDKGI